MHVTKQGIEHIKSANELAAVVAERGIALKRKGKVLVGLSGPIKDRRPRRARRQATIPRNTGR
jgi:hypothetical protein